MDRRKFLTGAGFLVTTLAGSQFLVGCASSGSGGETAASAAPTGKELRNLVYMTPFQHIIAHSDVYVAQNEGYFAEEGLLITSIGGTGTASSVSQVVAKQAMYHRSTRC